jgi:hypothetical protein
VPAWGAGLVAWRLPTGVGSIGGGVFGFDAREDHGVGGAPFRRVQRDDQADADDQADELGADESGYRGGGDAGKGIAEGPADGDGRVGE